MPALSTYSIDWTLAHTPIEFTMGMRVHLNIPRGLG